MVQLYKMISGKLVFVDYGVLSKIREYKLTGYHVCILAYRPRIPKRGKIICTHGFHNRKQWTMKEQIVGVIEDAKKVGRFVKAIFTPVQAWQVQLASA